MDEAGISLFNEAAAKIPPQYHLQFITVNDLRKRLRLLKKAGENESIRVVISSASEAKIDEAVEKLDFRKSTRLMWEEAVGSGILRLLPGPHHDITSRQFLCNIFAKVAAIPGHTTNSIRGVGSTKFRVPGRSKEGDETIQCSTRRWSDWPNIVIEVGYSEQIAYLRYDAQWWLMHGQGAVKIVIIIRITQQPDSLHIELWSMQANIPVATEEIDIDALGTVTPPMAAISIRYDILFDDAHPNAQDIVLTAAELSDIATTIYQGF